METFGHALGSVGVLLLPFSVLALFFLSLAMPVLVWLFFRNVARTRRALERIADALDSGNRAEWGRGLGR